MLSGWSRNYIAIFLLLSIGVFCSHASDPNPIVYFRLYTPTNRTSHLELRTSDSGSGSTHTISSTKFDPRWPTRVFVHGFLSDDTVISQYRDTYLQRGDYNFIAVDWVQAAGTYNYITAKGHVPFIATELANLLDTLEAEHGLSMRNVTIVGHSLGKCGVSTNEMSVNFISLEQHASIVLGAHIAGLTGKRLKSKDKIGCIFGLDPAGVGFKYLKPEDRLDHTDAEYVQVIHTDGHKFGFLPPIGHGKIYTTFVSSQVHNFCLFVHFYQLIFIQMAGNINRAVLKEIE